MLHQQENFLHRAETPGEFCLIRKSFSTFVKQLKTDCANTVVVVVRVDRSVFSLDKDVLLIALCCAREQSAV